MEILRSYTGEFWPRPDYKSEGEREIGERDWERKKSSDIAFFGPVMERE